ncbi:type I phosphodiesterase/nucleotide pyrophosphatase [Cellulomonas flavigena DSM 20109]|uniref:Type I phosphodiesterase/nucleotide pyrophosphatase n=1 Tax=Cellulomonas flavigena (strain ATCC 482 / DSM 20109 / BCRC 11376 / JCM 18109 / NBRC 3775 / NCIMB 8073 / NRS 134) TaxID=446466 RepID=D5UDA4_CELFN|nr:alkaline phosphatase family protein [Cellulomonas flavigena]ADG74441.1 type I phosphodiesterase/nucleotide pyrophosphatase [Cellulomonas flavigena DSM 20109]
MPGHGPASDGVPAPDRPDRARWRPRAVDVADALVALALNALGLGAAIALVDGVSLTAAWAVPLVALAVGLGDLVLRAPLRLLAAVAGVGGAFVAGVGAQVLVTWAALAVVPGVALRSAWSVLWVLLLTAVVMAAGRWVWGSSDNEYVVADVVRRARRCAPTAAGPRPPGLLVVQLDGVAAPVLEQAVDAGLVPTMQRWVDEGTHRLDAWWSGVPSTTPAAHAGILHGAADRIPAFRWWDRELGRLVVTNHPDDAALVEERLSDGRGLLAGGGAAVATMFSGDASDAYLVMSRGRRHGLGPGRGYVRVFARPFVLARGVTLAVGEVVKELYQARRQSVHEVLPRVPRGGWYVLLRAVTNVLLRDLATALVAEALVRGHPTVFVDLVDYDEIAHHAGPTRPESLRALEGLDQVLRVLEQVARVAPRDYDVVVLSDHGQALGATFEQVEGRSLLDTVRSLMAGPAGGARVEGVESADGEDWGPVNALLTSLLGRPGDRVVLGPDAAGEHRRGRPRREEGVPRVREHGRAQASRGDPPDVVVVGSGNLGLVWFPDAPRRLHLEDVQERWPGLVPGLAARPAVGVVVADSSAHGLVAVGPRGVRFLEAGDDAVEGEDPLAPYPVRALADLRRAARLPDTGDLLLVSAVGPRGQVHAFEGQVGSHGGLGGAQNVAFLLHPTSLAVDDARCEDVDGRRVLVGPDAVHAQLVAWLVERGVRATSTATVGEDA